MLTDVVRDLKAEVFSVLRGWKVITQPAAFAAARNFETKEQFKAATRFFLVWAGAGAFVTTVTSAVTGLSIYTNRVDGVISLIGPLFGLIVAFLFYPVFRLFSGKLTFGGFLSASCYGAALSIFSIALHIFFSSYYFFRDDLAARIQELARQETVDLSARDICAVYAETHSCFLSLVFSENPLFYIPSIIIISLYLYVHSSLLKGGFAFSYWKYGLAWLIAMLGYMTILSLAMLMTSVVPR